MRTTNRNRVTGELLALRDAEWLRLREEGMSIAELAEEAGMSERHVKRALSRARKAEEDRFRDAPDATSDEGDSSEPASAAPRTPWWMELVPLFPVTSFTPQSECPHRGPLPEGSLLCCMVCSASGIDGHPAMKRDPATDPRPEPKSRPKRRADEARSETPAKEAGSTPETRRQRRFRVFGKESPREDAGRAA
ncbi:sigma factor-like helix-turn-helix DNA-binding protein [Paludisphaera sp.]|uniref:sigma factor-like helix-turn-helix DNA-binding protein n=1 Tax=Paludisphaera sp. TaxID=2017432 RepID=UPI00301BA61A